MDTPVSTVAVFEPYAFKKGEKIHIAGSGRKGDWEVAEVSDTKVTLRCPKSGKTFSWARFCYFVREIQQAWPLD